jgi:hypothetical protein
MNTGQMLLTTGAMILLGLTVLTVNRNNLQSGTILRQTELGVYAISLATSYIEKASGYAFDEQTITGPIVTESELSTTLGRDASSELANRDDTWDDFDDFNGMNKLDTIKGVDLFRIQSVVYYVTDVAPSTPTATKTRFKRIDLKVNGSVSRSAFENPAGTSGIDTVKLSYIFSYFR